MILLSLLLAGTVHADPWLDAYFKKKDALAAARENEGKAVEELAALLKKRLGKPAFKTAGAHVTFQPLALSPGEMEYGCADSLHYHPQGKGPVCDAIVVTELGILDRDPKGKMFLSSPSGPQLLRIACDNSAHTVVGRIEGLPRGRFDEVHGFVTLNTQDYGPMDPNEIVVFVRKGKRVEVAFKRVELAAPALMKCKDEYPKRTRNEEGSFTRYVECARNVLAQNGAQPREYALKASRMLEFLGKD